MRMIIVIHSGVLLSISVSAFLFGFVTVGTDRALYALGQINLRIETEVALRVGNVAVPVALCHDFILVGVERDGLHLGCTVFLRHHAGHLQGPEGKADRNHELAPQLLGHNLAEFALGVATGFGNDIFPVDGCLFESVEYGARKVLDIDEGEHLSAETDTEIKVGVNALYHHQIVLLVRTVDPCWAQYDPRKLGRECLQEGLSLDFRYTVAGIGVGNHRAVERGVGLFVTRTDC